MKFFWKKNYIFINVAHNKTKILTLKKPDLTKELSFGKKNQKLRALTLQTLLSIFGLENLRRYRQALTALTMAIAHRSTCSMISKNHPTSPCCCHSLILVFHSNTTQAAESWRGLIYSQFTMQLKNLKICSPRPFPPSPRKK